MTTDVTVRSREAKSREEGRESKSVRVKGRFEIEKGEKMM